MGLQCYRAGFMLFGVALSPPLLSLGKKLKLYFFSKVYKISVANENDKKTFLIDMYFIVNK